ncbi:asparagine synthase (glutamine-hydrolysing) [uncultured Gammaproteobacteria bacterium]
MCGFAGLLDSTSALPPDHRLRVVEAMAERLIHRGPDDGGTWADPTAGLAFGFRRLSILDLSPEGHQPMVSHSGRHVMVFNGEIYNFAELRAALDAAGIGCWRGHSDTEILLESIDHFGIDSTLPRLNGMFALAVWDRQTCTLHLARDPLGEKPLYWGRIGATVVFASEAKAFKAHPGWRGEPDPAGLAQYLRFGWLPAPFSAWRGIAKLPAGHRVRIEANGHAGTPEPFWSAADHAAAALATPFSGSEAEAVDQLDRLIRDAVALRMVADVPVGAFLSGGIDSSTVVAMMQAVGGQAMGGQAVRSFSIGFDDPRYDESPHAAAVARHLGTEHTELRVGEAECLATVPKLVTTWDEPFADASQIPTLILCALTRRYVTVALTGDGGDEVFGGYPRFTEVERLWQRGRRWPRPVRAAAAALGRCGLLDHMLPGRSGYRWRRKAARLGFASAGLLHRDLISLWTEGDHIAHGMNFVSAPFDRPPPPLPGLRQQSMFLDAVGYLPEDLMAKVDRASMAASLEARAPLLDPRIAQFSWSLPESFHFQNGHGKSLLRQVLYRYVPRELVDRPKMGFEPPLAGWLRGPLRDWAEDLLDPARLTMVEPGPVRTRWREHLAGRNWTYPLWTVLVLQQWFRDNHQQ